jgi:hypothetical protein
VWIQEWFDRFRVLGIRRPYAATVEFPSSLSDDQRKKAFAVKYQVFGPTRRVQDGGSYPSRNLATGIGP